MYEKRYLNTLLKESENIFMWYRCCLLLFQFLGIFIRLVPSLQTIFRFSINGYKNSNKC